MISIFAQAVRGAWSFTEMAIAAIVVAGVVAVVVIVLNALKIPLPSWFWSLVGVVVLVVCAIFAVRLISSM